LGTFTGLVFCTLHIAHTASIALSIGFSSLPPPPSSLLPPPSSPLHTAIEALLLGTFTASDRLTLPTVYSVLLVLLQCCLLSVPQCSHAVLYQVVLALVVPPPFLAAYRHRPESNKISERVPSRLTQCNIRGKARSPCHPPDPRPRNTVAIALSFGVYQHLHRSPSKSYLFFWCFILSHRSLRLLMLSNSFGRHMYSTCTMITAKKYTSEERPGSWSLPSKPPSLPQHHNNHKR